MRSPENSLNTFLVRQANSSDFDSIVKISKEVYDTICNKFYFNWPTEQISQELQQVETLIIKEEGAVLSFLCFRDLIDVFEISVLATQPSSQKKNLQSGLIIYLQAIAAKRRASLVLEVHCENIKAISLYKKLGFEFIRVRKQYYRDNADALIMSWNSDKAGC